MLREPYEGDEKRCFTLFAKNNKECSQCPLADDCQRVQRHNSKKKTFREWARDVKKVFDKQALSSESIVDAEELVQFAANAFRKHGGKAWNWTSQTIWLDAFDVIITYCVENNWLPQDYVTAQIDALHRFCIDRKIPLRPNMFTSVKSHERFERWRDVNRVAYRRDTRLSSMRAELDQLQAAESDFAILYFSSDLTMREAYAEVRERSVHWSLKKTKSYPHIRAAAIVAGLSAIAHDLSDRLLVPDNFVPKYKSMRKLARMLVPQQTVDSNAGVEVDGIFI